MQSKFASNRGVSIIAALILVVILGGILILVDRFSPSAHVALTRKAFTAQAFGAIGSGSFDKDKDAKIEAECVKGIKLAAARGSEDSGPKTTGGIKLTEFEDLCVSVVFKQGFPNPNPNLESSYECKGKSSRIGIDTKGFISEMYSPNRNLSKGVCSVVVCSSNGKCIAAKGMDGINNNQINKYSENSFFTQQMAQSGNLTQFDAPSGKINPSSFSGVNGGVVLDDVLKQGGDKLTLDSTSDAPKATLPIDLIKSMGGDNSVDAKINAAGKETTDETTPPLAISKEIKNDNLDGPGFSTPNTPGSQAEKICNDGGCSAIAETSIQQKNLEEDGFTCESGGNYASGVSCTKVNTCKTANCTEDYKLNTGDTFTPPAGTKECVTSLNPLTVEAVPVSSSANCITTGSTGNNNKGIGSTLSNLFGSSGAGSFLSGLIGGLGKALGGSSGNSNQAAGNTNAQPAGTCNVQYICGNNALYYRNSQCVDQLVQSCQYGCANSNTCNTQNPAPYGKGSDGAACNAPITQPTSLCSAGWQSVPASNGCPAASWKCGAGDSSSAAVAQLSCSPQTADVGMAVAISYACQNATSAQGGGFSTAGNLSGSTTTVLSNPPANAANANFALSCTNSLGTVSAQCSVAINRPSIILVANPNVVPSGTTASIGWITTGMSSCVVSSPDMPDFTARNANYTNPNGVATTSAITAPVRVVLNCQTNAGGVKTATTTLQVGAAPVNNDSGITVSSTADNATIGHGDTIRVTWSATTSANAAIALWLYDITQNKVTAVIAAGLSKSGTYDWRVPASGSTCTSGSSLVCASDLLEGRRYSIDAVLYTPPNAYLGLGTAPSNPIQPTYGRDAQTASFTVSDNSQDGE